jgi:hypothetical protein
VDNEKFNQRDLERAVTELSMLRYWTADLRGPVMHLLAQICPHQEALQWLVAELVNHIGEWPGPAEVRGLLCTRYSAADGIDQWCNLPGYRAADYEARYLEQHEQCKAQERGGTEANADLIRRLSELKRLPPGRTIYSLSPADSKKVN